MPFEHIHITANTPFIENPQMEDLKPLVSPGYVVVCDLVQVGTGITMSPVVVASQSELIAQFGTIDQGCGVWEHDPAIEIFRSTVQEKEHWCTTDDLEALEEGFQEGETNQSMLSVKDDTNERLPLYCHYVNGRLETVYPPFEGPYEFDKIKNDENLTTSSDL